MTSHEEFIEKAQYRYGDYYDYNEVVYSEATLKVRIICPIHGAFLQSPENHLIYGCSGCPHTKTPLVEVPTETEVLELLEIVAPVAKPKKRRKRKVKKNEEPTATIEVQDIE